MDRESGVFLLLLCGIAIGAGGPRSRQRSEYDDALERERGLVTGRDRLVRELAKGKAQRDNARANEKQERGALEAGNKRTLIHT